MKPCLKTLVIILISIINFKGIAQKRDVFKPKEVYKSKDLIITQIAKNSFEHTSFKQTNDFGYVPCNGLIVRNSHEVVVFDTPTNDKNAEELIKWIKGTLHCKINAIIPTHFHDDCLGGLKAFDDNDIPSYAYFKTIELAKENNYVVPKNSFKDSLILKVVKEHIVTKFFGEGHTKDNVVGYYPSENILFGGCLIKELEAGKGYLGDATIADWSSTVEKVKKAYPNVKIVVPGHGEYGNKKLLDYTIKLFKP
ncbi:MULTISPECIES: subclass B1 metallo-beta-lactamase [unclassified Arcicella]|uniref:subclass B1 metallo-beta-lactamase n=1 Tax=unclassified Arcicella TaxID=2644986 RepID=UPI00285EF590|nr:MULTISPECIES: subclass B1 metallo-beta-lactamase [unclassified Arcicella]MDR6562969.1 metallo-beta-lactamase class B [Arcicella sp. BE51]MDR6813053.1 metallo-beta-lactamase class B [Arcicella sp. BE140]MDR6824367.1 metallo-beta-lactamase class B [Arcicella sp. BE139]